MSTYTISDHSADEYRAMAKDCTQRSHDSWERSDTDGFLSQWASDSMARTYDFLARLAESGGDVQEIDWLFTADGTPVDEYRWVKGQYGDSVRVWHNRQVTWFRPSGAKKGERRQANDLKKGFVWGTVRANVEVYTYDAGMSVGNDIRVIDDSAKNIVEVVTPARDYADYRY